MFMYFAIWLPLALPVQEPKAAPPAKTTDNGPRSTDKTPWTPKDREMVVLLGSAFIEQEARDGYLETELIRLFPNKDIRVRNLGWSGDTVHCQARSYFGPPQEGFDRLRGHLQMIKPTTVICCYGANESWKGEPGIEGFRKGYEKLIDMIREATGATVVLMTPPRFFDHADADGTRPMNDANERLERYIQEIRYIADGRRLTLVPLWEDKTKSEEWLKYLPTQSRSFNGVLLSATGHWYYADRFAKLLRGPNDADQAIRIDWKTKQIAARSDLKSLPASKQDSVSFEFAPKKLSNTGLFNFEVMHAPNSKFRLFADGKYVGGSSTDEFKKGHPAFLGPHQEQLDRLRLAIVKKNALFFHRWRPANETYLYGFRKHEQGNNGVEPPMFDKLVEQAEAEIAVLKKPVPHKYELIRVEEKK